MRRYSFVFLSWCLLFLLLMSVGAEAGTHLNVLVIGVEANDPNKLNTPQLLADNCETLLKDNSFLPRHILQDLTLRGVVVPMRADTAWTALQNVIQFYQPDVILAIDSAEAEPLSLVSMAHKNDGNWNMERSWNNNHDYSEAVLLSALRSALLAADFPVVIADNAESGTSVTESLLQQAMKRYPGLHAGIIRTPQMPLYGANGLMRVLTIMLEVLHQRAVRFGMYAFEPLEDDITANLKRIQDIVKHMAMRNVNFHVFPEMALTGFVHKDLPTLLRNNPELKSPVVSRSLRLLAAETSSYVAVGMPFADNGAWYNGYLVFDPSGTLIYRYAKNRLYGSDHTWAKAGQGHPLLTLPCGNVGVLICHDVVYPDSYLSFKDADALLIATNWIGESSIFSYIQRYAPAIPVLVSDRNGTEEGIVFPGNTGVLLPDRTVLRPRDFGSGLRGVQYLCL